MTRQSLLPMSWVWSLVRLGLSPAFAACALACSATSWSYRTWRGMLQLPYTTALVIFAASELLAGDAVAFLSSKPSTRQQLLDHQGELLQYRHLVKDQARRIQALQADLSNYRFEHDVVLNTHEELLQEYEALKQQLEQQQQAAAAAASTAPLSRSSSATTHHQQEQQQMSTGAGQGQVGSGMPVGCGTPGAPSISAHLSPVAEDGLQQRGMPQLPASADSMAPGGGLGQPQMAYRQWESHPHTLAAAKADVRGSGAGSKAAAAAAGESWALLHVSVAVAAVCVRWWLAHLHDPLQRKICWVVIWPGVWLYGSLLLRCLRGGPLLRTVLCCGCWALAGYIGHAMVQHSVSSSSMRGMEGAFQAVLSRAEGVTSF